MRDAVSALVRARPQATTLARPAHACALFGRPPIGGLSAVSATPIERESRRPIALRPPLNSLLLWSAEREGIATLDTVRRLSFSQLQKGTSPHATADFDCLGGAHSLVDGEHTLVEWLGVKAYSHTI